MAVESFICGDEAQQYSHSIEQKIRLIKLNFNDPFKALLLGEFKGEGKKEKVGKPHMK